MCCSVFWSLSILGTITLIVGKRAAAWTSFKTSPFVFHGIEENHNGVLEQHEGWINNDRHSILDELSLYEYERKRKPKFCFANG